MSIAFESATDVFGSGFGSSVATTARSHTAGRLLVAFSSYGEDPSFPSSLSAITDTAGDTWTRIGARVSAGYAARYLELWSTITAGHASNVVTASYTGAFGAVSRYLAVHEVSGVDPTTPVMDGPRSSTGTTGATATTGTITVTGEAIILAGVDVVSATPTVGSGYTVAAPQTEYKLTSASAAATWTWGPSTLWAAIGASFAGAVPLVTVAPPTVTSGAILTTPTITPGAVSALLPTIASGALLTAPIISVGLAVAPPTVAAGAVVQAPTLAYAVAPPALTAGAVVTTPAVAIDGALVMPFLASGALTRTPTLAPGAVTVALPTLASGTRFAPSLAYALAAPSYTTSPSLFAPTLAVGAVGVILPMLGTGAQVVAPTIHGGAHPDVDLGCRSGPMVNGAAARRGTFTRGAGGRRD